jgi:hypothetical protein
MLGFGISMSMAYARSLEKFPALEAETTAPSAEPTEEKKEMDAADKPAKAPSKVSKILASIKDTYETLAGNRLFVMFSKYCFVLAVGILWFLLHPEEQDLQQEQGVEMTFIDAAYFATVMKLLRLQPSTKCFIPRESVKRAVRSISLEGSL